MHNFQMIIAAMVLAPLLLLFVPLAAVRWHRRERCDWCGAMPIVINLDGDDLCAACASKWVVAEGQAECERYEGEI